MFRNTQDWILQYQGKDALWIHDGDKRRPHALLASGNHSGGFFNSRLVIADEGLLKEAASDLLELFVQQGGDLSDVWHVVGPQTGATKLAELIAHRVKDLDEAPCYWASPEKRDEDGVKSMVFAHEDLVMLPGGTVLLCEDVLTTGGSVDLTVDAIIKAGGVVLPFILVLVNRSGLTEVNGKKIVALIDRPLPMWAPEECPLCKEGSEALRPKDNWAALNAVY